MLWRKMFRDMMENKIAYIACIIVIAIGLTTYTSMSTAKDNLFMAKDEFYKKYHFADGFAQVKAVPYEKVEALSNIEGIDVVEGRLVKDVRVLMPDTTENIYLRLISLNHLEGNKLNGIHLIRGSLPEANHRQIILGEKFSDAHQLEIGQKINVAIEGKRVELAITGSGQSPEYVYALKDLQSIASDPRTFEVAYVPYEDMEMLFDQKGLVNDVSFTLEPGFEFDDVKENLKTALEPYELEALYAAEDQMSEAMLSQELEGLEKMAASIPFVFLIIAAIILYIMVKRLVESQRGQIGTMKAFGYGNREILIHYLSYGLFIGTIGGVLGGLFGTALSTSMIDLYQDFFSLPSLQSQFSLKYFLIGIVLAILFSMAAAFQGARGVTKLQPAEAMRPPIPIITKKAWIEKIPGILRLFNVQGRMAIRNILRNRNRSLFTFIGIVFTFSLMASFFSLGTMADRMILDQFTKVQKQDVKLTFSKPLLRTETIRELQNLEGIKLVEPFLEVPVSLKFLNHKMDVVALGIIENSTLYNVFDKEGKRLEIPKTGMMVSEQVAKELGIQAGDVIQIDSIMAKDTEMKMKVEKIIPQFIGANVYLNQNVLIDLLKQGEMVTSALLSIDPRFIEEMKNKYETSKFVSTIEIRQQSIEKYNELMELTSYMLGVMAIISIITGFSIVYNSSIISLAERKRELASLRVLGMTPREVMEVISVEQWLIGFAGILAGIPFANLINKVLSKSLSSDLFTMPDVTYPDAIVQALLGTIFAIWISQRSVSRKIKQLDLVSVLKERE